MSYKARVQTREIITSDVTQTAAVAAFIGGFVYTSLEEHEGTSNVAIARYTLACVATHMCVCSTLVSAILYRILESVHDDDFERWTHDKLNSWLLKLPLYKFLLGTFAFLLQVLLQSWQDMNVLGGPCRYPVLAIGIMGMTMVLSTYYLTTVGSSSLKAASCTPVAPTTPTLLAPAINVTVAVNK